MTAAVTPVAGGFDRTVALDELLAGFADLSAGLSGHVTGLADDSRAVRSGEVFFATRGLHHHGLDFLDTVRAAGAAAVVWEPPYADLPDNAGLPLIAVDNLRHRLGPIAERFYGNPCDALTLIGITGTDGKTSTSHFIAQALTAAGSRCGLIGTLGYGLYGELDNGSHTTPDALTVRRQLAGFRDQGIGYAVMEVSSHALDQGRVAGVPFTAAVLTNLTRDHLDYHGSEAAYAAAKRRLFEDHPVATAVVNLDDRFGRTLAADPLLAGRVIGYGSDDAAFDALAGFIRCRSIEVGPAGLGLTLTSSWGEGRLDTRLLGRFNAANLMAALGALIACQIPFADALNRLGQVSPVPGRMERFGGDNQPLVVIDYAHTPYALEQVLRAVREHVPGRISCVFGCGGDRDPGKRPLMGAVAGQLADWVVVTSDNPRSEPPQRIIEQIVAGIQQRDIVTTQPDRAQAIEQALATAGPGDAVLIAGKGHEDYQILADRTIPFSDAAIVRRWLDSNR